MEKKELILIGGGGHCKSCIEVIESVEGFVIKGILDVKEKVGTKLSGYDILGTDEEISFFVNDKTMFLITVGQIKDAKARMNIAKKVRDCKGKLATIISPLAILSKRSSIGEGTILMNGVNVNADVIIGTNAIINTNANIEHDAEIGDFVHVSTSAVVNGGCRVGAETFIGSGSILVNGISICNNVLIGAGTIVNRTIETSGTYVGNPCHQIKR
ncbi:sugar O-acyltransferase (sialic acid O-acetyltransferase NeuD family) [Chitinophaga niastensis]|uniref:Sugar O-acyltransferase (Sialic acid O-acetyltransferase NeuD family) n=1 Tax=Chitinophaga niastensis TaxID=536980 RepID=A0A2P8HRZ1_CHINA|nr:acetyltransferase [Chitinophaga niastensis]PSL48954.1 sugar O-acyltransferase (sialic acid O-acetyltransferase NeuD family) [Chitinophaga niastensis]